MKKVLVVCGTGVATSTIVTGKVKNWLLENDLMNQVELHQGKINDTTHKWNDYDFIISTTIVPDHIQATVIDGVSLLTGIGTEDVYDQISRQLE
ncbi:PTS sugar transporter subunit IIB [Lentibacillus juripiscarius]|uniref:PTS sugar transporter subunit IIB n=1 Tax=Lentibacillus juripiscarius TaxID=257446 RepID=A0ABW5VC67_9BACI